MIKRKLKELSSGLKKPRVQAIFSEYKKNDGKILHSSAKLIASESDIAEAFKYMHQIIETKIKNSAGKD